MRKHINADFFKLVIAFLIICASLKPGLSDAASTNSIAALNIDFINAKNTALSTYRQSVLD